MFEDAPFVVVDFQHVKPGKGNQFTRTKLKNLITGQNREVTFKQGEKFGVPDISHMDMTFLYKDGSNYTFMNPSSFEQLSLSEEEIGGAKEFLTENLECSIVRFNERVIEVDVPNSVVLQVKETDPNFKGNTVTGSTKPAVLETGYTVQVPMHINQDDFLKIDTRTGNYVERVNK